MPKTKQYNNDEEMSSYSLYQILLCLGIDQELLSSESQEYLNMQYYVVAQ